VKYRKPIVLLALLTVVVGAGAFRMLLRGSGPEMVTSGQKFLGSLTADQRGRATMAFDDPARLKWHFIPLPERKGLQIKDMSPPQRALAHDLLESGLSQIGYDKATTIMSLEKILRELEKSRVGGPIRDPERYYFTIFGTPDDSAKWGWSVEGHHLSLNFVVDQGRCIGHTPSFFGANPATVKSHEPAVDGAPAVGTRVLAKEEDLAFQLFNSLDDAQRKVALLDPKAPKELRSAGDPQAPTSKPEGLAAGKLTDAQKQTLQSLIKVYADNMAADIAAVRLADVDRAGLDQVYFAWAGANKPGIGHYYRLQGPTFLVEFCNTQPDAEGNVANHIHSLWRDLRGDFGVKP
jgi:hypothetical protein